MHVNSTTDDDAKAKLVRFLHSSMDKHGALLDLSKSV